MCEASIAQQLWEHFPILFLREKHIAKSVVVSVPVYVVNNQIVLGLTHSTSGLYRDLGIAQTAKPSPLAAPFISTAFLSVEMIITRDAKTLRLVLILVSSASCASCKAS